MSPVRKISMPLPFMRSRTSMDQKTIFNGKRQLLFAVLLLSTLVGLSSAARADANDFVITNFASDYSLSNKDPQGELEVRERIDVIFADQNHGILRAIPKTYKNHDVQPHIASVKQTDGTAWPYTTYSQNDNIVLKIGDPNQTVTGSQTFIIDYTVRNVISFYEGYDELYWDINGDQSDVSALSVSASVRLAPSLQLSSSEPRCYTGIFGSTSSECKIAYNTSRSTIGAATTHALSPRQTLTIAASFKKGYFQPPALQDTLQDYWKKAAVFLAPIIVLGGGAFILWLKRGRDGKGRGLIVPEFDAPDGFGPIEAGMLVDFKVDNRDLTAVLIDLARRGYVKIIESEDKQFAIKSKLPFVTTSKLTYSLELRQADFAELDEREESLLKQLFPIGKSGETFSLSGGSSKLYKTAQTIRKQTEQSLTEDGYFHGSPSKVGRILLIPMIVFAGVLFFAGSGLGVPFVAGGAAALFISWFFWRAMPSRSGKGATAREHIMGLKLYLETAESDRIKLQQSPDAKYAPNKNEPVRTVELFEKLLPFAIVLGVEKGWAEQFKNLYTQPPDWYGGSWNSFSSVMLVNHLNTGVQSAVSSSFTAPSNSSGSGFSNGGGFSGGGGGGGGVGGW